VQKNNQPTKETLATWHKNPSNWKWGTFYCNKNDKRIFPPKWVAAFGWTVNFANPYSIVVMIVMVVFILTIVTIIKRRN
jgi:uncharacterized membrane protein